MLLDIWSVLGGIGLAAVAFIVVMLVCVVILRLLAAILPSYEDRDTRAAAALGVSVDSSESSGEAPEAGVDDPERRVEEGAEPPVGEAEAPVDRAKRTSAPDEGAPI